MPWDSIHTEPTVRSAMMNGVQWAQKKSKRSMDEKVMIEGSLHGDRSDGGRQPIGGVGMHGVRPRPKRGRPKQRSSHNFFKQSMCSAWTNGEITCCVLSEIWIHIGIDLRPLTYCLDWGYTVVYKGRGGEDKKWTSIW